GPVLALGGAAAALPAIVDILFGHVEVHLTAQMHFFTVGFSALVAAAAAIGLTVVGARRRDTRTVLVGTGFSAMAALLALHGFSTPGVLVGGYGVVAFTGGATLPVGGAILALSAFRLPTRLRGVGPLLVLQGTLLAAIVGLGASAFAFPALVPPVPAPRSVGAVILLT